LAFDKTGLRPIFAPDRNGFAFEVDIALAIASICAWRNEKYITIKSGINRRLDCLEIGRAIIVNGDYPCLACNRQQQADRGKNQLSHLGSLLKTEPISGFYYTILLAEVKAKPSTITAWQYL
jgi:hypothetical protein